MVRPVVTNRKKLANPTATTTIAHAVSAFSHLAMPASRFRPVYRQKDRRSAVVRDVDTVRGRE
jgi:hypothetical protein